jgi:lipoyl(octanoyl) transferase
MALLQQLATEITCRALPHEAGDGPANMALDEALLDDVAGGRMCAYLRTYGWSRPTLSIGYFQGLEQVATDPRFRDVPVVRRLTGGGAIWHHHELTYALIVPAAHPLSRPSTRLYRAVHDAIAELIGSLGIYAARRGNVASSSLAERKRPLLCFTGFDPEDIVTKDVKVVGSAQRRRAGAVLQHGSVLLARSWRTPELAGVCDVADAPSDTLYWSTGLLALIPGALGMRPSPGALDKAVRERAEQLERTVYRDPAWTALRR